MKAADQAPTSVPTRDEKAYLHVHCVLQDMIRLNVVRCAPPVAADAKPLHTVAVCQSFPCDETVCLVKLCSPQVVDWLPVSKLVIEFVSHDLPGLLGSAWRHFRMFGVNSLPVGPRRFSKALFAGSTGIFVA